MIKHFFIMKEKTIRYICNEAVDGKADKITNDYHQVTCKNCKRQLERKEKREKI